MRNTPGSHTGYLEVYYELIRINQNGRIDFKYDSQLSRGVTPKPFLHYWQGEEVSLIHMFTVTGDGSGLIRYIAGFEGVNTPYTSHIQYGHLVGGACNSAGYCAYRGHDTPALAKEVGGTPSEVEDSHRTYTSNYGTGQNWMPVQYEYGDS